MLSKKQNNVWFKFNGFIRFSMVHMCSDFFPLYIVNEYPKSGGSWLAQMLSEALNVPFPRNRLPMLQSSIMHGHYIWPRNMKNVVVLWRDGRDILISQYYHSLFKNERGNSRLVERTKAHLKFMDYHNIKKNLPDFIEYTYVTKKHPKFSWADFVSVWGNKPGIIHVKYEGLRENPSRELQRIIRELTGKNIDPRKAEIIADKYSFEKQSGRKPGQESANSFMRKGIIGDWKNHFSPEAKRLFDRYAGDALIELGYERDHLWAIF